MAVGVLLLGSGRRWWLAFAAGLVISVDLLVRLDKTEAVPSLVVAIGLTAAIVAVLGISGRSSRWRNAWPAVGLALVVVTWVLFRARGGMPVGLSFLAVKLAQVMLEGLRRPAQRPDPAVLATMALFPPTFESGPMHRYDEFARSLCDRRPLAQRDWAEFLRRIIWGGFQVSVVCPYLKYAFDFGFENPSAAPPAALWVGLVAYSLYLYLNFSGVSHIAIGWGEAFGIKVPENFSKPYSQLDIQAFWRCWHMTFTRWLTAYVFMPISKRLMRTRLRRKPRVIAWIGYVVTFAFCGLWHGREANYLVWGLWHGIGLCVYTSLPTRFKAPSNPERSGLTMRKLLWWAATFSFVTIGWLFFACPLPEALMALRRMLGLA